MLDRAIFFLSWDARSYQTAPPVAGIVHIFLARGSELSLALLKIVFCYLSGANALSLQFPVTWSRLKCTFSFGLIEKLRVLIIV